ncbi:MAG: TlpA disulfide reductase family protein [Planctomycetota bacterium]
MVEPKFRGEGVRRSSEPRRGLPPFLRLLIVVGLGAGLYYGVTFGVRVYVDHRIAEKVGTNVVDFALRDTEGVVWRSSELRGNWIVLHFVRSQCHVCIAERRTIVDFEKRLDPAKARLFGVLLDPVAGYPEEMTHRTLELLDFGFPVLLADADFVDTFHGQGWTQVTPVTYVIDPTGRIVHALRGRQDLQHLLDTLPESVRTHG